MGRTSQPAISPVRRGDVTWMQTYMIDILALPLIGVLTLNLWCGLFGVTDKALVSVLMVGVLGDAMARIAAARADRSRPATFCDDRRLDLVAGIVIGTGPWPIAQVMGSRITSALEPFALPAPFRLAAFAAVVMMTAWRLAAVAPGTVACGRRLIRNLSRVPDFHVASLRVLAPAKVGLHQSLQSLR